MIISVMRDATVSAFAVTIDELEELHDTLRQEFPEPKLTETRIERELHTQLDKTSHLSYIEVRASEARSWLRRHPERPTARVTNLVWGW